MPAQQVDTSGSPADRIKKARSQNTRSRMEVQRLLKQIFRQLSQPDDSNGEALPLHELLAPNADRDKEPSAPDVGTDSVPLHEPSAPNVGTDRVLPLQEPSAPTTESREVVALYIRSQPRVEFGVFISGPHHQIVDVIERSYPYRLGLRKGDRLFRLNNRNLPDLSTREVVQEFKAIQHECELIILRYKVENEVYINNDYNDSHDGTGDNNAQQVLNNDSFEEICMNISIPKFQELIVPLDEIPVKANTVQLKHKKSYNAYVKSISCSNRMATDACLKYEENNVVAAPIRNENVELWQCKVHLYKSILPVDGQPCVIQVGPDGHCIACRHDNRSGNLMVYPTPDYKDPVSVTSVDECVFYKKAPSGSDRIVFQSATMPNVYLCMDDTTLVAKETRDVEELGNSAKFDLQTFKAEKATEKNCILTPFRFLR